VTHAGSSETNLPNISERRVSMSDCRRPYPAENSLCSGQVIHAGLDDLRLGGLQIEHLKPWPRAGIQVVSPLVGNR